MAMQTLDAAEANLALRLWRHRSRDHRGRREYARRRRPFHRRRSRKLLRDLKDAFPEAEFVLDQTGLAQTIAKAAALVDAPHLGTDLPRSARLALELAVWKALQAIPAGETRTYGTIARSLPMTATAQDVGAACAANRIALPCPATRREVRWLDLRLSLGRAAQARLINMEGVRVMVRSSTATSKTVGPATCVDWDEGHCRSRRPGLGDRAEAADPTPRRTPLRALSSGAGLPQPCHHGPARLWPRR